MFSTLDVLLEKMKSVKRRPDRGPNRKRRLITRPTIDEYKLTWLEMVRARALERGLEFNLTIEDFNIPKTCPALKIKLVPHGGMYNSPSIDRIDNSKGYIKGNTVIVSMRANRLKNDASLKEIKALAKFYSKFAS